MRRILRLGLATALGVATLAGRRWWQSRRDPGGARGVGSAGLRNADEVQQLYDRIAPYYDALAAPYRLVDGRRLARAAIDELRLRPGDTVIDLGTGTGWNLPRLAERVGPEGRVIGVDLSPEMLARAQREAMDFSNVELVEADIARYEPPVPVRAVIMTFSIEMLPNYREVIERYVRALEADGRIVSTGLRDPDGWPPWLTRAGSRIMRVFGVNEAYKGHRPWQAIEETTEEYEYRDALGGVIYLASGTRPADPK